MSFHCPSYPVGYWSGGVNLTHLNTDEKVQHKQFIEDLLSLPENTIISISSVYQDSHFQLLFFPITLVTQGHPAIELYI